MDKFNTVYESMMNEADDYYITNLPAKDNNYLRSTYSEIGEGLEDMLTRLEKFNLTKEANTIKKMQKLLVSTKIGKGGYK